jgi:hypothetical protein
MRLRLSAGVVMTTYTTTLEFTMVPYGGDSDDTVDDEEWDDISHSVYGECHAEIASLLEAQLRRYAPAEGARVRSLAWRRAGVGQPAAMLADMTVECADSTIVTSLVDVLRLKLLTDYESVAATIAHHESVLYRVVFGVRMVAA